MKISMRGATLCNLISSRAITVTLLLLCLRIQNQSGQFINGRSGRRFINDTPLDSLSDFISSSSSSSSSSSKANGVHPDAFRNFVSIFSYLSSVVS